MDLAVLDAFLLPERTSRVDTQDVSGRGTPFCALVRFDADNQSVPGVGVNFVSLCGLPG